MFKTSPAVLIVVFLVALTAASFCSAGERDIEWLPHEPKTPVSDKEQLGFQLRLWLPLRNLHLVKPSEVTLSHLSTQDLAALARQHDGGCSGDNFAETPAEGHAAAAAAAAAAEAAKEEDVLRRLRYWRQIIAPDCATVAAAKHALRDAGLESHCIAAAPTGNTAPFAEGGIQTRFDALFCSPDIPVGKIRAAFPGVEFERVREVRSGHVRLSVTKEAAEKMTTAFSNKDGIDFVSNHIVGDKNSQPQRRFRPRAKAPSAKEAKKIFASAFASDEASSSSSSPPPSSLSSPPPYNPHFMPLPSASVDGNAPQLLAWLVTAGTSINPRETKNLAKSLATDLHCDDGKPAIVIVNETSGAKSMGCASPDAILPDVIQPQLLHANGSVAVQFDDMWVNVYCAPVPPWAEPVTGYPNTTVGCHGDPDYFQKADLNEKLGAFEMAVPRVRARFSYGNGTQKYSQWSYLKSWWNASYYDMRSVMVANKNDLFTARPSGHQPQFLQPHQLSLAFFTTGWTLFPADYQRFYNLPDIKAPKQHKVAQAMFEVGIPLEAGTQYQKSDLAMFMNALSLPFNESLVHYIGGAVNGSNAVDGETQLDVQTMMSTAPGMNTYMYIYNATLSSSLVEIVVTYWNDIVQNKFFGEAPSVVAVVHSMSYGLCISSVRNATLQAKLIERGTVYAAVSSSSGIQILAASGDASSSCSPQSIVVSAGFPASIPHVISVGATMVGASPSSGNSNSSASSRPWQMPDKSRRVVCDTNTGAIIGSGGGIQPSNIVPAPKYQTDSVSCPYEKILECERGDFGRMVPDISAIGTSIFAVIGGSNNSMAGTSFSCPLVASFFALIASEIRDTKNVAFKSMAEFVYSNAAKATWRDVTRGTTCYGRGNPMPTSGYFGVPLCYSAIEGYDWTTGLGEIDDFAATKAAATAWADTTTSTTVTTKSSTTTTTTTTTTSAGASTSGTTSAAASSSSSSPSSSPSGTATESPSPSGTGNANNKNNGSDTDVSVAELIGVCVGALIAGILIGALVVHWRHQRQIEAEEDVRTQGHYFRDELRTQVDDNSVHNA